MTRRVSLPGASDLFFRSTSQPSKDNGEQAAAAGNGKIRAPRRGSPRTKHDTKITVYLSQQELIALEHARLTLRATHELTVDRGRLVREAVAVMLADFEENGQDSVLVRRLRVDAADADEEPVA